MRKFWALLHQSWPLIKLAIMGSHAKDEKARYIPCDPDAAESDYTVEQDIDMCKKNHSLRIVAYLQKANKTLRHPAGMTILELIKIVESDPDGDGVWVGKHPMPT